MSTSLTGEFIYENLRELYRFNPSTALCIFEDTGKLYVQKKVSHEKKSIYEKLIKINNPHLPKILHIENRTEYLEVVREYISGDTLSELIESGRRPDTEASVQIIADVCDGLCELHKIGLVHRDINPNNTIITNDGRAVIIDYEITRTVSGSKAKDTTILGTVGYAAPEQFGFSESDPKTDIYAVGVLINVLMTGKLPDECMAKGDMGKIVRKCIEIDSKKRYQSIESLKAAVQHKIPADSPIAKIIGQVPGLRSKNIFINILSVAAHLSVFLLSILAFMAVNGGFVQYIYMAITWILCIAVPYLCFFNFLDIWNRLPLTKGAGRKNQILFYYTMGLLSIIIGLIVLGLTYQ